MDMVIVCGIAAFLFGWAFTYGIADGSFDEEVSVLEDNTEGMDMDTELSAEDEALIDEELMEDELDTEEAETEDLDAELAAEDSGGDILPGDTDNFEEIPAGNEDLPPATESGAGLNDACLDSGFSQAACSNYLFSDDPGGYCRHTIICRRSVSRDSRPSIHLWKSRSSSTRVTRTDREY